MYYLIGTKTGSFQAVYDAQRLRKLVYNLAKNYIALDDLEFYISMYPTDGNWLRDFIYGIRDNDYGEVSLTDAIRYLKAIGHTVTEIEDEKGDYFYDTNSQMWRCAGQVQR